MRMGKSRKMAKKTVYTYIKQPSISYCRERSTKRKSIIDRDRYVKAFVSNKWTLEYCLLKSELLSEIFKSSLKTVHSDIFNDACTTEEKWEEALARIMLSKSIKKTEIANQITTLVESTNLNNDKEKDAISYLRITKLKIEKNIGSNNLFIKHFIPLHEVNRSLYFCAK